MANLRDNTGGKQHKPKGQKPKATKVVGQSDTKKGDK